MKIFWWTLLLLHVAVGLYQLDAERWYMADSYEYITLAENLESDRMWYSADPEGPVRMHHYTKRPPVYSILLWFCHAVCGSYVWICLLQIGMSMLSIWLAWKTWQLLTEQQRLSPWILPFLLLYPAQWMYTQVFMTEIFFQLLLTAMVYCLIRAEKSKRGTFLWIYAALLLISMLTKPVMYLFCLPHLLLMGIWAWKWKKIQLTILAIIPLIFVLSFMSWNQKRTGYFHYSSIQNLSLLQYTTYGLLSNVYGQDSALVLTDSIHYAVLDAPSYAEGQKLLQAECTKHILTHKLAYAVFHLKGMGNFFLDPGRFDLYHILGIIEPGGKPGFLAAFGENGYAGMLNYLLEQPIFLLLLLLTIAGLNGMKLIALAFVAFNKRITWMQKILLAGFVLYIATLTGTSGASRFAIPIYPLLLICMALFIDQALQWREKKRS